MLKTIRRLEDLNGNEEMIAEFFVDSVEERLGMCFSKEIISQDIKRVLILKFSFLIMRLNKAAEIEAMILAYPANLNSFVSIAPESTISMYIDPANIDQKIWSAFMTEMQRKPFRNIFYLKRDESPTESFFINEGFSGSEKMILPESVCLKIPKNPAGIEMRLMKKIMTPKEMGMRGTS